MHTRFMLAPAFLTAFLCAGALGAGEAETVLQKIATLEKECGEALKAKNFDEAAAKCHAIMQLAPRAANPVYNLGCVLALQGKTDEALAALDKAVELGYDRASALQADADLAGLRNNPHFAVLLEKAKANAAKNRPDPVMVQKLQTLEKEMGALFSDKKYSEAAAKCREMIALVPRHPTPYYFLASLQAKEAKDGKTDEAWASLSKAVEMGLDTPHALEADDNLTALKADKRFAEVLASVRDNQEKHSGGKYEKGAEWPGLKSVEHFPDGGLRYRVLLPEKATEEHPARLVIWLHPAGASLNAQAEALAPIFAKHNFALLVLTQKQFMGWDPREIQALMSRTMPDAWKVPGIERTPPIMLGHSAGAQAALWLLAQNNATKFNGFILTCVAPVDVVSRTFLKLPKAEDAAHCPFLVLVGQQEDNAAAWKKVEDAWRTGGIPLTLRYIAGKGHTWLWSKAETELLDQWLAQLEAGKIPADPKPGASGAPKSATPTDKPAARE